MKIKIVCSNKGCFEFIMMNMVNHSNGVGWWNELENEKRLRIKGWLMKFVNKRPVFFCTKCKESQEQTTINVQKEIG